MSEIARQAQAYLRTGAVPEAAYCASPVHRRARRPTIDAVRWPAGRDRDGPLEVVYVVDHDALPALPPYDANIDPYVHHVLPEIQEWMAEEAARSELEAALSALPHADVTASVLTESPPV